MRVAIIPARGGSKRIPRKNIKLFSGKPMIVWSIEAALASGVFDQVIVSTDDEEIAEVSKRYGATVPFLRPPELSGDTAPTMPVLRLHLDALSKSGRDVEIAFCVYATAPFIKAQRLIDAMATLCQSKADFVLGVTPYDYPVQRALRIEDTNCVVFAQPEFALARTQQLDPRYHDAGQFFGGWAAAINQHDSVLFATCRPVMVPRDEAVDIDTSDDWDFAEKLSKVRTDSAT